MAVSKNVDLYASKRMGIFFPGFPSYLTGQCVSLVKWYLGEMCGVKDWQSARGHAKDFGDTLVKQHIAVKVPARQRKRGDIVVWKQDGGGYGHIGVLLSGDRVFEENVHLKGVKTAVYGGNVVSPSMTNLFNASWRRGLPTVYRVSTYVENIPKPVKKKVVTKPAPAVSTPPVVHVPEEAVPAINWAEENNKLLKQLLALLQGLVDKINGIFK